MEEMQRITNLNVNRKSLSIPGVEKQVHSFIAVEVQGRYMAGHSSPIYLEAAQTYCLKWK